MQVISPKKNDCAASYYIKSGASDVMSSKGTILKKSNFSFVV